MFRSLIAGAMLALTANASLAADITFAVTDIEGLEQLQQEFGAVETALEKATGLEMDLVPVNSRTAAPLGPRPSSLARLRH
jgi:phosphonate transport system substrate-binding protein